MDKVIYVFKKYYLAFSFVFITVISLSIMLFSVKNNSVSAQEIGDDLSKECVCECDKNDEVLVDIKGAVKKPGVYRLSKNSIVDDVIKMAGGLNKNASTDDINLSKAIYNEMVIYVSTKDEIKNKNSNNNSSAVPSNNKNDEDNICIPLNKININTANVEQLQEIKGVGEAKALKIIEYRNTNGLYKTIEDIKNVSGIGDSFYEKIKDYITV